MATGNESWEEVRYHVLGQLPELNKKIDKIDEKIGNMETKMETNFATISTKLGVIVFSASSIVSIIVGVITSYFGG